MRHKVISKDEMIETAQRLIRDEGLSKCSMRRISKELGIASGTVYNYYSTREALLKDVFIISWNKTIQAAKEAAKLEIEPFERLKQIYNLVWTDVKNRRGLGKEIFLTRDVVCDEKKVDIRTELMNVVETILKEVISDQVACQSLSRWFFVLTLDDSINNHQITDKEWILLAKLMNQS